MFCHLFAKSDIWCSKSIPLAIDCRVGTASNGIHLPMGVVIVHHMEISMPTSWHSLDQPFSKVIEGYGDLHVLIFGIRIAMPKQHHFVMVSHVIVRNCYGS